LNTEIKARLLHSRENNNMEDFNTHKSRLDVSEEYDDLELLERLESLREDMEDLGVSSLSEVIERIEELHRLLDEA